MEKEDICVGLEVIIQNLGSKGYWGAQDGFEGSVGQIKDNGNCIRVLHKGGSTWLSPNQMRPLTQGKVTSQGFEEEDIVVIIEVDETEGNFKEGALGKITVINDDGACGVQVGLSTRYFHPDILRLANDLEKSAYSSKLLNIFSIKHFEECCFYTPKGNRSRFYYIDDVDDEDEAIAYRLFPWNGSVKIPHTDCVDYEEINCNSDLLEDELIKWAKKYYHGCGFRCLEVSDEYIDEPMDDLDWDWDGEALWVDNDVYNCKIFDVFDGWAKAIPLSKKEVSMENETLGRHFFQIGKWYRKEGQRDLDFCVTHIDDKEVRGYGPHICDWKEVPWVSADFKVESQWRELDACEIVSIYQDEMKKRFKGVGFKGIHSNLIIPDVEALDSLHYGSETHHVTITLGNTEVLVCIGNQWAEPHTRDGPIKEESLPAGKPDVSVSIDEVFDKISTLGRPMSGESKIARREPASPTREKVVSRVIPMLEVKER